jgi:GNAT superfamily N-acetyltransferase
MTVPQIGQRSVKALARAIEPHAEAAWPARETLALDGWLLRFGEGYSSRLNSVSALNYAGADLAHSIEAAEAAYRARHLPPLFHISPANDPPDLEAALRARGYTAKSQTLLMTAAIAATSMPDDIFIRDAIDADFECLTREGSHSPADGDERLAALERVTHPRALVVAMNGNAAVACGASVVTGDWASVFVMRTTPSARRQGHGRRVLAAIASWARQNGAAHLYLQVDHANAPAIALYERAGFHEAYRYLHYIAP